EQAFRFHAIRDEAESLVLSGLVERNDEVIGYVRWVANLGIRNAGTLSLTEAIATARRIEAQLPDGASPSAFEDFLQEVKERPEPLQHLVAATFTALALMLVANDRVARAGLWVAVAAEGAAKVVRPL